MREQWRVGTIDTTKRPPLAEVRAWTADGAGSRFVCEALPADADRIVFAMGAAARLEAERREVSSLRGVLARIAREADGFCAAGVVDEVSALFAIEIARLAHETLTRPARADTTPGIGREDR